MPVSKNKGVSRSNFVPNYGLGKLSPTARRSSQLVVNKTRRRSRVLTTPTTAARSTVNAAQ